MLKMKELERNLQVLDPDSVLKGINNMTHNVFAKEITVGADSQAKYDHCHSNSIRYSLDSNKLKSLNLNFKNLLDVFPDKTYEEPESIRTLLTDSVQNIIFRWMAFIMTQMINQVDLKIRSMKIERRKCENPLVKEQLGFKIQDFIKFSSMCRKSPWPSFDELNDIIYHVFRILGK